MTKDEDGFSVEMAKMGVKPLKKRHDRPILGQKVGRDINIRVRRESATSETFMENHPDQYAGIEWLGPHDVVEFKRAGIQHEVFKILKQGRCDIGAHLDLHQYRVEEARVALLQFINDCIKQEVRYAIVVHGKGWHALRSDTEGEKTVSRIKSHVVHWLKLHAAVQAFSSAQARDGGTGALYILFKKGDRVGEKNHRLHSEDKN